MPAISSSLDTASTSPAAAVIRFFAGAGDLQNEGAMGLKEADIQLTSSSGAEDDLADDVWSWTLADNAPIQRDQMGEAFIVNSDTGKLRPATADERVQITRGVVAWIEDYGGYVVSADGGEGESDEALVEYATATLDMFS